MFVAVTVYTRSTGISTGIIMRKLLQYYFFLRKDRMVQSLQSELRSAPKQDYVDK